MCCTKVLGTLEVIFNKEIFDQFNGSPVSLSLRTHNGDPIGGAEHRISLKYNSILITFDKPKEGCCQ